MAETAIRFICCILFFVASVFDEWERKIPRWLSYLECFCACIGWGARYYVNPQFVPGNICVSAGLLGLLFIFYLKGRIGRADLYIVFSMFVLLSQGQTTRALIWEENMLLCVAFISASIRLVVQRFISRKKQEPGCPFAVHLLIGYLVTFIS